jgi:hypothetical protein
MMFDAMSFPWRRHFSWLACVLTGVLHCAAPGASFGEQPTGDLTQRFLDEAPRRWQDYYSWAERLDGAYTVSVIRGEKQLLHAKLEIKHNSRCRMMIDQDLPPDSSQGRILAYNPAYSFRLQRKTAVNPWAVADVAKRSEGVASATVREVDSIRLVSIPMLLFTEELPDFVHRPTFHVLRTTPVSLDGTELVRVEFDNAHPIKEPERKFCPVQSGSMLLDPNRFWYVRSCEVRCKFADSDCTARVENQLADLSTKYPVLKRQVVNQDFDSPQQGRVTQQRATDYDLHEPSPLPPDDDFTLTAFGFPEPFDVPKKSVWTRWYVWTGIGGVLCLGAGLAVQRFRRRQVT